MYGICNVSSLSREWLLAALGIDATPTEGSENLITSGGVYEALSTFEGSGKLSVPVVTADPESPAEGDVWVLENSETEESGDQT